jgi:hypothetical protein
MRSARAHVAGVTARTARLAPYLAAASLLMVARSAHAELPGAAPAEEEAHRVAASSAREIAKVVPLPPAPWSDAVIADVNASLPVMRSDELRLNGDLTVGYNHGGFGVVGRASAYDYEVTTGAGLTDTVRYDGDVSAWGYLELAPTVRCELRGAIGAAFYDTTSVDVRASSVFVDETSLLGRGQALAGVRWDASERFVLSLVGGGGLQLEAWDGNSVTTTTGAKVQYVTTERTPTTLRLEARARAEWRVAPGVLTLRVRLDLESLAVTRSDVTTAFSVGTTVTSTSTSEVATRRQTEVFGRLFVDVDALRVLDFRPTIHGGLNAIALGGASFVAPVFGVGIRREAF